jgi:hypothetical protein
MLTTTRTEAGHAAQPRIGARRDAYALAVALDLFAGIPVRDYHAANSWYERLLGRGPAFIHACH